ncbi:MULTISPECIES: DUF4878 domain-containing protein [unclassified Mycolicibacterium]|uniref:DUF4878 domain-containing protein n=1 Tax=unclassified Mycolicibacterium TaxID=2636767 RepID=UPI0012DDF1A9|nr:MULTISPECIES: DUF4878 domain-containing protein [unclassified Mycolicibacterium]MUL85858.1 DUF4878 domain-containing protein [Mycolicibacterium sp. CBMA 329]MUL90228.1 DUF4878 domain-containing protein [Mycolicibacterium sp. CBMA 331]MUM00997.1 DUF4878 domain-containing protein [Mycolicibacterium sp. CBMA 334]MUM27131.1 DUF4878 domain-containing protein [Mycolicibacterium sp. CBMA 295]MUM39743.1 DUF4878 domain-containing protein [Mycolicibacterium sp. CBMA 247]
MPEWSGGQFGDGGQPPPQGWPTMNPGFSSAPPPHFPDFPLSTPPPVFGAPTPPNAPGPKRRKGLFIALAAAAVVAVLVMAVLVVVFTRSGSTGGAASAEAAATGYLEALARGDAKAALSYGKSQPASTELLTDEILNRQIAKWPITDIRVLDTTDNSHVSQVHVTAKFGDEVSEAKLLVEKQGGWKLLNTFIKIDKTQIGQKDAETLTVFGKPIDQPRYVFPGWVDVGSSSPYLSVTSKPMGLQELSTGASVMSMSYKLSDSGEQAIRTAITDSFTECTNSNLIRPPNCPVRITASNYVDGTAKWGPIEGADTFKIIPLTTAMTASVVGTLTATITLQHTSGAVVPNTVTVPVSGSADLTTSPPKLTWN